MNNDLLQKIENYIFLSLIFLLPIFFLPIFPNAFTTPKLILLIISIFALTIVKILKLLKTGSLGLKVGLFDFPLLVLVVGYLASSVLRSPNLIDPFFLPGTATIILCAYILYVYANQLSEDTRHHIKYALFASASLSSIIVLLASSGLFTNLESVTPLLRLNTFNTLGNSLFMAIFMIVILPIGISLFQTSNQTAVKALFGVASALIVFSAIISVINTLPKAGTTLSLPGYNTSWVVGIDTLKEQPLLGMGPGNYLTAFNRFRPEEYNATDLWQIRFNTARSHYLTIVTETGLVGLAAIFLLLLVGSKIVRNNSLPSRHAHSIHHESTASRLSNIATRSDSALISLIIIAVAFVLFPADLTLIVLALLLLSLSTPLNTISFGAFTSNAYSANSDIASKIPSIIVSLPVLAAMIFVAVQGSRVVAAEYTYKTALDAIAANDGGEAYNRLLATIQANPRVDRYRASYAQVNLALANSIAQNPQLTDQDRATITQLIQQAIREAKATVALNPQRANNWEVLANTYQAIIPLAEGADVFAVQTYSQAIALDPLNPNTRIALGGIFYAQADYETAIRVFELAAAVKPDYANAHYNLAYALKEAGRIDAAIQEMATVLSLVERDSQDYDIARAALEEFEGNRAEATQAQAGNELTPPQPDSVEQIIEPPIELTEDSEPPEATPRPEADQPGAETPSPTPQP